MLQRSPGRTIVSALLGLALVLGDGGSAVAHGVHRTHSGALSLPDICPQRAVFLALEDQVRGYPADATGPTPPCQLLAGPRTMLSTARSLAVSIHGNPHVVQFLSNGSFAIFPPRATGDVAPNRTVFTETNDLTAIAVDSHIRDYVLSVRQGPRVFVYHDGLSSQQSTPIVITDPSLAAVAGIAIDSQQNLVMAGYDANGQARIDTFHTATEIGPEVDLVRSLSGPRTGLLPGSTNPFGNPTMSIAVNPVTGELFVFAAPGDGSTSPGSVRVFAANAHGDVPPLRVIGGSSTGIAGVGILGTNKIAVARDGRLFVAQPNATILVFAAGANGNVPPASTITDSTLGTTTQDQGGIAVR
ncbi:MAG TPA: hypothetical protein VNL71_11780 [Chloroflexota bacterium]|nr:hypothetical protein [Chloroflexota bacterium]